MSCAAFREARRILLTGPPCPEELEKGIELNPKLASGYDLLGGVFHHLALDDKSRWAYDHFQKVKSAEQQPSPNPAECLLSSPKDDTGPPP